MIKLEQGKADPLSPVFSERREKKMKITYLYRTKKGKLMQAIFYAEGKRENKKSITFFLKNDEKIRIEKDFILSIENED